MIREWTEGGSKDMLLAVCCCGLTGHACGRNGENTKHSLYKSPNSSPELDTWRLTLSVLSRGLLPDKRLWGTFSDKEFPRRASCKTAQLRDQRHPEAVAQTENHQPDHPFRGRLSGMWPAMVTGRGTCFLCPPPRLSWLPGHAELRAPEVPLLSNHSAEEIF